jgi:hypothetical protein
MTDEQLEELAADRAHLRDTTFRVYQASNEEFVAAFSIPSPIEEGEWGDRLSARDADRREAIVSLLAFDDLDRAISGGVDGSGSFGATPRVTG